MSRHRLFDDVALDRIEDEFGFHHFCGGGFADLVIWWLETLVPFHPPTIVAR